MFILSLVAFALVRRWASEKHSSIEGIVGIALFRHSNNSKKPFSSPSPEKFSFSENSRLLHLVNQSPYFVKTKNKRMWLNLFSGDAVIEDPVGSVPLPHREANFSQFYDSFIGPNDVTFKVHEDIVANFSECTEVARMVTLEVGTYSLVIEIPSWICYSFLREDNEPKIANLKAYYSQAAASMRLLKRYRFFENQKAMFFSLGKSSLEVSRQFFETLSQRDRQREFMSLFSDPTSRGVTACIDELRGYFSAAELYSLRKELPSLHLVRSEICGYKVACTVKVNGGSHGLVVLDFEIPKFFQQPKIKGVRFYLPSPPKPMVQAPAEEALLG